MSKNNKNLCLSFPKPEQDMSRIMKQESKKLKIIKENYELNSKTCQFLEIIQIIVSDNLSTNTKTWQICMPKFNMQWILDREPTDAEIGKMISHRCACYKDNSMVGEMLVMAQSKGMFPGIFVSAKKDGSLTYKSYAYNNEGELIITKNKNPAKSLALTILKASEKREEKE